MKTGETPPWKIFYAAGGEVDALATSPTFHTSGAASEFQQAFGLIFDRWRGNPEQIQMSDAAKERLDRELGGPASALTNLVTGRSVTFDRCAWLPPNVAVIVEGIGYRCPTCKGVVRPDRESRVAV